MWINLLKKQIFSIERVINLNISIFGKIELIIDNIVKIF